MNQIMVVKLIDVVKFVGVSFIIVFWVINKKGYLFEKII